MINFLSLLTPTAIKAGIVIVLVGAIAGFGFYLGDRFNEAKVREVEILALQCEQRARERETELTRQALEAEKQRLEYEKELTARIEDELRKNGVISKQLEEEMKKRKVVTREVVKYVNLEIQKTVYRECVVPPTGVSTLIKAARDYNAPRDPSRSNN